MMIGKTSSFETSEKTPKAPSRVKAAAAQSVSADPESDCAPTGMQHLAGNLAVQRLAKTSAADAEDALSQRIRAASSGGSSLDRGVRSRLEYGLSANLSDVRVHTDGEADQLARSLNAEAFTSGQDIFFRTGAYDPRSDRGIRLLAHEAAHVVQQGAGLVAAPASGGVSISTPGDAFEQAATRSADNVVAGVAAAPEQRRLRTQERLPSGKVIQQQSTLPAPSPVPPSGPTPLAPHGPEGPEIPRPPKLPEFPDYLLPGPEPLPVDLAGLAASAAAVVLPLAAAGALAAGLIQGSKLAEAEVAAANAGVAARRKAELVATGYAHVMTGGANKGDEGSTEAERQIASMMAQTNASREQVIEAVKSQQGGYYAIYEKNLKRIKDRFYAEAVAVFEESHQGEFGLIERLGETWGMRGAFRRTLRIVLYGEG